MQESVDLVWHQVTLAAPGLDRLVLDNLSGFAPHHSFTAIMGPSGSGKTSLVSVLAGKCWQGNMSLKGAVMANNKQYKRKGFGEFGAFVFQNDVLLETLTVKQSIRFSAKLRLDLADDQIQRKVDSLIQQFQLVHCQDTKVGGKFTKGVSGGQRKRTCVAIQLVADPQVILLDQPTSGLDSFTALVMVRVLKQYSKKSTVICTIHQPSSAILNTFDQLIVLSAGQTVFQGHPSEMIEYSRSKGFAIPEESNPADEMMLLLQKGEVFTVKNYLTLQNELKGKFISSDSPVVKRQRTNSFFTETLILYQRGMLDFIRNPMKLINKLSGAVLQSILVGGIFWMAAQSSQGNKYQSQGQLQQHLRNVVGSVFVCMTSMIMAGIFGVLLTCKVFNKSLAREKYSASIFAYYLSKLLIELPFVFLSPFLFSSIIYWMLGLDHEFVRFIRFALTIVLVSAVGNSLGLMTGSLFKDATRASSLSTFFLMPLMLFSGLYSNLNSIYKWISWMQYLSPFKYGLQALTTNELIDKQFYVLQKQETDVIARLGFGMGVWECEGVLMGLAALFYLLAFIFLRATARGML